MENAQYIPELDIQSFAPGQPNLNQAEMATPTLRASCPTFCEDCP